MSQYRRFLRRCSRTGDSLHFGTDDMNKSASPRRKGLLLRTLALMLAVGLTVTMLLSDLPRALLQREGYAESSKSDASESLDRIYSILQGSLTNPTTYDDYYQLASISIGKGDYAKAMEELDKCLELADKADPAAFADVWTKKGSLYALQNKYDKAISSLGKALNYDPKAQQALLLRAQIYIEQNKYDKAIGDLEEYVKTMPDDASTLTTLAQLYEATGSYEKARGCYEQLYAKDPTDGTQRLNSLRCAFLLKKYKDALTGLDEYLGGETRAAGIATTEPAASINQNAAAGTTEQTEVEDTAGAVEEPGADATKAPVETPADESGDGIGATETVATAVPSAGDANALPAQADYAHYLRALCHMQFSQFDLAVTDLTDALSLGYDEALCFEQMTACDYALGKHEQVLEYGEKLIALNKSATALDVLYQRMGVSAMTLEKTEEAVGYLAKSLELNAALAGSHYYRGLCLLTLKKYEDAIKDFTASIEQNFLVQFCYYNRGVCYVQLSDYDNALTDMDKTLSTGDDQSLKDAATKVLWQLAQYYENEKKQQQPAGQAATQTAEPSVGRKSG